MDADVKSLDSSIFQKIVSIPLEEVVLVAFGLSTSVALILYFKLSFYWLALKFFNFHVTQCVQCV